MQKISGILPPSNRIRVADISTSQPARPGAPAFGRPMGRNSLGDRITLSKKMEELRQTGILPDPDEPAVYKPTFQGRRKAVVEELNEKFFSPKTLAREDDIKKSEEALDETSSNEAMFYIEKQLGPLESPLSEIHEEG